MKKAFLLVLLTLAGLTLSACTPPPPLKSANYLSDKTLVSQDPCGPPCFQGITVGSTTFSDAVTKLKANAAFSNVQTPDPQGKPPQAQFNTVKGEAVGQVTADAAGVVNAILVKLAPDVTAGQIIEKYGDPEYVTGVDYSQEEVALALIFPKIGLVAWVTPGDANGTLQKSNPVVVALYLAPGDFPKLLETATLKIWTGYQPYKTYASATAVVTPKITVTPQ